MRKPFCLVVALLASCVAGCSSNPAATAPVEGSRAPLAAPPMNTLNSPTAGPTSNGLSGGTVGENPPEISPRNAPTGR